MDDMGTNTMTKDPSTINTKDTPMKPVIVTTEHRGVFYGQAPDDVTVNDESVSLTDARMAIYWGTTKGLFELAHTGPTAKSRISAPADVQLNKVTAILEVTPEAVEVWSRV